MELKLGSCITQEFGQYRLQPGVVGPFVQINGINSMFFLTANRFQQYFPSRIDDSQVLLLRNDGRTIQRRCGKVFAGARRGSRAVLVKISDDLAPSREELMKTIGVHFAGISPIHFPEYDNRDKHNMAQVIVFGKQTRTAVVKIVPDNETGRFSLYTYEIGLFKKGDAGAAVFLVDQKRMLHCLGICDGYRDLRQYGIYPIGPILKQLAQEIGQTVALATFDKDTITTATTPKNMAVETSSDNTDWAKCIELRDEMFGHSLLERNLLPDQRTLNRLTQTFGRRSKLVENVCSKICSYIKNKHDKIINVLPTYKPEDSNKIIFLIILREEIHIKKENRYSVVKKYIDSDVHRYGEEGKYVIYNKLNEETPMSYEGMDRLRNCVNTHAETLMKKHKLLTIISGGSIRSRGYGSVNAKLEQEVCMVLYVLFKGYIPIHEEPFSLRYQGVAIDVREGMFNLFTLSASSYLENLQMGCQIARKKQGTAGGFLEYRGYGLCALTCAHVLLDSAEIQDMKSNPDGSLEWEIPNTEQRVYQPDKDVITESRTEREHFVGRLVKAIYRKGGGGESGMEIALFQVEKRYPISGEFPRLKDGTKSEMRYDSGKSVGVSRLNFGRVKKFGATSDKTDGVVSMDIPITSVKHLDIESDTSFTLHNLLEVKTLSMSSQGERMPFSDYGDSGALVFCEGQGNELLCIGMIHGGTTADTCVVMPIMPILQVLDVPGFKNFENECTQRELIALKKEMENLKDSWKRTNASVSRSFQDIENKFTQIQQKNNN